MNAAADKEQAPLLLIQTHHGMRIVDPFGEEHLMPSTAAVQWLHEHCLHNGSSLQGRIDSFRAMTATVQKSAVLVSERTGLLYFPLFSMHDENCIWVRHDAVLSYSARGAAETQLLFMGGTRYTVPVNRRVIKGQIERCERFLEKIGEYRSFYAKDARNG